MLAATAPILQQRRCITGTRQSGFVTINIPATREPHDLNTYVFIPSALTWSPRKVCTEANNPFVCVSQVCSSALSASNGSHASGCSDSCSVIHHDLLLQRLPAFGFRAHRGVPIAGRHTHTHLQQTSPTSKVKLNSLLLTLLSFVCAISPTSVVRLWNILFLLISVYFLSIPVVLCRWGI